MSISICSQKNARLRHVRRGRGKANSLIQRQTLLNTILLAVVDYLIFCGFIIDFEINVLFSANFGHKVVTFCALFRHLQRDTSKIFANYYVRITYQYQDFGLHLKQQQVLC